jgi:hypothetical protein
LATVQRYSITKPGDYMVQFSGAGLQIGQSVPNWEPGAFGENETQVSDPFGFFGLTNRLPPERIKIEVMAGRKP